MDSISHLDEQQRQQLIRICWLYYIEELTHKQIGERLGLSRVKVTRLLRDARNTGMVQISIEGALSQYLELEQALCKTFSLRDAVVVMEATPGPPLYLSLADGTAQWLSTHLKPDTLVGLSLGRTLSYLPNAFRPTERINCHFTELVGGGAEVGDGFSSYSVALRMAELTGGQAHHIHAPAVVSNPELRNLLLLEPIVAQAMERARGCDIALQSIGALDQEHLLYQKGYLSDAEMKEMIESGIVGDILNHYINQDGQRVPTAIEARCIALSLDNLRSIPWSVCIAGGTAKKEALLAALRSGLFNVLITDATTAHGLLEQAKSIKSYISQSHGGK